jgi:hypothetical protein
MGRVPPPHHQHWCFWGGADTKFPSAKQSQTTTTDRTKPQHSTPNLSKTATMPSQSATTAPPATTAAARRASAAAAGAAAALQRRPTAARAGGTSPTTPKTWTAPSGILTCCGTTWVCALGAREAGLGRGNRTGAAPLGRCSRPHAAPSQRCGSAPPTPHPKPPTPAKVPRRTRRCGQSWWPALRAWWRRRCQRRWQRRGRPSSRPTPLSRCGPVRGWPCWPRLVWR